MGLPLTVVGALAWAVSAAVAPVPDIDAAEVFYTRLLGAEGRRVSPERHYFDCGDVILACHQPGTHGDRFEHPSPDYVYFAEDDLEAAQGRLWRPRRAREGGRGAARSMR